MTANFTWLSAAIGGAMIGLSAALMMLLTGRTAGISGILGGLMTTRGGDVSWRAAFIVGLVAAPALGDWAGFIVNQPEMPASWIVPYSHTTGPAPLCTFHRNGVPRVGFGTSQTVAFGGGPHAISAARTQTPALPGSAAAPKGAAEC